MTVYNILYHYYCTTGRLLSKKEKKDSCRFGISNKLDLGVPRPHFLRIPGHRISWVVNRKTLTDLMATPIDVPHSMRVLHVRPCQKCAGKRSCCDQQINPSTPNDHYSDRTAPLTSKFAFYIFIQQIQVLNILNMVYNLRFFLHNSNVFVSCIIHILYIGCAKIKKIIPAPKG